MAAASTLHVRADADLRAHPKPQSRFSAALSFKAYGDLEAEDGISYLATCAI
jgi:hypothetical protein